MTTSIIVSLRVEGIHCWPECPLEEVKFLRSPHRHEFHIIAEKNVTHDDRDVEIIMLKRSMESWLHSKFGIVCDFGRMSCEQIASSLVVEFDLSACTVLEDGENGGKVTKADYE